MTVDPKSSDHGKQILVGALFSKDWKTPYFWEGLRDVNRAGRKVGELSRVSSGGWIYRILRKKGN